MFIEYPKLVYFTDTDILERLTTVNKPYKVDVKVYKTTWSWLHFTYSVIFYQWPHTYSDCKTASIFAEVKNARVSGHTKSLEREGENGEWDWALQGVWGSRAFCENLMPALRVFAKQIMKKKKKTDCFPVYIRSSASESRNKKDVIYTETVYNNKSFDNN